MQKKFKALGIGNAIVDAICKTNENFLSNNNLTKGSMKLINSKELDDFKTKIKPSQFIAGGSVANSMVGLSSFGNNVCFSGKVNNDEFGKKYIQSLEIEKVEFDPKKKDENEFTGTCFVLITPDGERTMCTYLGIANKLDENDIDENKIKDSELILIEGYLWDTESAKEGIQKSIDIAKKESTLVSLSLSDTFCVERFKNEFLNLSQKSVDILFGNEGEYKSLFNEKDLNKIIKELSSLNKTFVITRGSEGATAISKKEVSSVQSEKISNVVDLTGAGDLFASGFIHGYLNNFDLKKSLEFGTKSSGHIIQNYGARPKEKLSKLFE